MDYLNITRNNVTTDTIADLSLVKPVLSTLQGNILAIYLTAVGKLPFILFYFYFKINFISMIGRQHEFFFLKQYISIV